MTEKIGLKEQEYEGLKKKLQELHKDNLTGMGDVLKELEGLNESGGGFYITEISPKVARLIEELKNIQKAIQDVYEANEEAIESFTRAIDNYDTMC